MFSGQTDVVWATRWLLRLVMFYCWFVFVLFCLIYDIVLLIVIVCREGGYARRKIV